MVRFRREQDRLSLCECVWVGACPEAAAGSSDYMPVTGMSGFILFSHIMRQKRPGGVNGVQKENGGSKYGRGIERRRTTKRK